MGMATAYRPRETPKPQYQGTVVCPHCHAEFMPSDDWAWGHYDGTSTTFLVTSLIKREQCPLCWRNWQQTSNDGSK